MKGIKGAPYRGRLGALTITDVSWLPYSEHQVVRGFQLISCYQGQLRWGHVVVYVRPKQVLRQFGYIQTIPSPPISHPFVTPTQKGDEPRQLAAPDVDAYVEPHVLEVPVTDDLPRHSVVSCEGCEAIAERLKRMLNLKMVTAGTKLHEIMKDCLLLAKGEASNGSLRMRRRQRID
ncbi:uncharacterized protein LOC114402216 [Glycine soja]|uniref:uncharacterized protein LOC114402216 n=1 Tax=Glycine soja TaxID=3848 RepID=UPI00103B737F|nr:uncharacterized protein LOC114402216 [Glycine soja]